MSNDVLGYSSHDWRKHTDDAVVIDDKGDKVFKVNSSRVIFTNPKTLREETVDVSRLIRVFVNNYENLNDVKTSKIEFQSLLHSAGFNKITTEIKNNIDFYFAETYHQQYLYKNPNGYCGLGGCGVTFK